MEKLVTRPEPGLILVQNQAKLHNKHMNVMATGICDNNPNNLF